jgi:transcriptional regulator of arginine metabolism
MNKAYRQGQILKLIRARTIHTQEELAHALKETGILATQVTLSRDVRELHLAKTPDGYRQLTPERAGPSLATLAAEFVQDVRLAQNLLVAWARELSGRRARSGELARDRRHGSR